MKKRFLYFLFFGLLLSNVYSQTDSITSYTKKTYMIPMRDGVKLFTVILSPSQQIKPNPFLLERTPYGSDFPLAEGETIPVNKMGSLDEYARDGYIFVFQDIRGKFKSEGTFEMTRPLYHLIDKTKTDESTDAYDTVDWLVKNIANNNGKAGIHGVSYPGYLALDAAVDPHPALKASSPQASPADMFLGDDFHHNGAFRLSYGFEYSYMVENDKLSNSDFPFPQYDLYNWYLQLGSLKNVNEKYFKGKLPAWNDFIKHPNHDEFWAKASTLTYINTPQIPIMHVGGYFDQEDLNGPQIMYQHLEKKDNLNRNFICLGPWNHGGWERKKGDSLGEIKFGSNTAAWFHTFEKQWFDYWLKDIGKGNFSEANCFQTGSNTWKTYESWPPKKAELKKLYANANHKTSFTKPFSADGSISYVSDPASPIPYRTLPIEATYGEGSRWNSWHVADQRFVSTRPDVVSFVMDSLKQNITVTGKVIAHLFASTTASDADFVVKLIDVYPAIDHTDLKMSGYQLPIAMEVIRGRFRKSFENPSPLEPGKIEEFLIDLHDINHTFLKGHQMMIQIQSTWFPIIDRNPQKYVPNIFEANESDYIKATHTIYFNNQYATYIELPVIKE
ncbi:MAG TPA: CocE/NonD family hydrolase [Flavobacterium sp.]|uniref:CocE/NonD family hydrolase n=1 Tax=Flavobacterium sp. TaxID=239 RepID=UPI002DB8E39F|nr:CocE/NonD family hydrolase [Flavobacterium sp.]HEU4791442.1 CocE/NonD family hydrolase [Flavobacterium sp.]